ncbi:MAG: SPASM domain-containing protein [Defluviitaleaceae bacterium]|nr:SPASM domain-containing protein [Defluviitaleaceae bacterium]
MKRLIVLIKPASSLCDMGCHYCFYNDVAASRHQASLGIMRREVAAVLIKNVFSVLATGDHITFAFQGGEPGLAGLDYYLHFINEVKKNAPPKVKVHYALQTNGLMINDGWCAFFKENNFLIGLSLDGDASLHNQNRMDSQGKGTFNRVMDAKRLLDRHDIPYNILCVLTSETARRAKRMWSFILKENIRHIQFIPCLAPLGEEKAIGPALTPEKFYRFYTDLFPLWKKEAEKGNVILIRLFEDIASLFLTGRGITCGLSGRCTPQIIVEADGGVYPCDFYVLDAYRVSDLTKYNLQDAFEAVVASGFLEEARPLSAKCSDCAHSQWCKGGCKRMYQAVYGGNCGMRLFLDECLHDLLAVARRVVANL